MNLEDEFDKIIRQKAEQAEFPYDERNWEKFAMLRQDQQPLVPVQQVWQKALLPAAAILAGCGLFLTWYFYPVEATTPVYTSPQTLAIVETTSGPDKLNLAPTSKTVAYETSIPTTEVLKKTTTLAVPNSNSLLPATKTKPTLAAAEPLPAEPQNIDDPQVKVSPEIHGKQMESSNGISKDGKSEDENRNYTSDADTPAPSNIVETEAKPIQFVNLYTTHLRLPYQQTEKELSLQLHHLSKTDDDYVTAARKVFYTAYAGVHFGLGWSGESKGNKEGAGTNYFGGLDVHYLLKKKIICSAGLQYYNFTNIVNPYYTAEKKEYGFGYTQAFTTVTTDHLMFLAIPVKAAYCITDALEAGIGLNTGYLVAAHSRIDSYGVTDGVKSSVTSTGTSSIFQGTKSFNFMGTAFLNIHLTEKFSGFAEVQYGMTDLFQNYKRTDKRQNSTGFRIGLNYYFGKK